MRRSWLRGLVLATVTLVVVLAGLFVINGTSDAWKIPESGREGRREPGQRDALVVVAYNIAKCDAWEGLAFRDAAGVRKCLRKIAALVKAADADLVFLNESVRECGPEPIDQITELARATGLGYWMFGENYRWGLPFYRIRSGNALLSRYPLRAIETQALPGQTPFYSPLGNRRLPWGELRIGGRRVLAGSVRNDSFDIDNNLVQVKAILRKLGRREALLAGDFNAPATSAPMKLLRESGRFSGSFDGPPTFPADVPAETIDFILAPRSWTLVEHHVPQGGPSDHRAVVSTFRLPPS